MNIKHLIFNAAMALFLIGLPSPGHAQLAEKVESFPVSDVRLTESPFKHAEDIDICYLLGLDADRLLAPYLKGAGLAPKAENYPNWENTGLDGHIGGHYLSALAYMYAATGNRQIKERLDYVITELKRCQDAAGDGYLCGVPNGRNMWKEIKEGNIRASGFGLNDRWVPLYNIHKIYAGLRDAYLQTGSISAKEMLVKLTDWMDRLVSGLTDVQMQEMLRSEHGGLNEVFADVAAITGNKKYLALAHKFSHQLLLQPLLQHQDKLTGMHANTQIPKVIGFKRIADIEGNKDWSEAANFFWQTVVNNRSISIGGNSVREHFHPADDFSSMFQSEQGPETCNTYNMLRLSKLLYQTSANVEYMDYYERALYNHILSTQDPVQGGFVYFTPMRPGHYRVYSQPQTSFWCCVGSGLENHARYGEMIYGSKDNNLYVNLFIPSVLTWKEKGVRIDQQNKFPDEEATTLLVNPQKTTTFALHFRCPEWVKPEELRLSVNGQDVPVTIKNGFVVIERKWSKGDKVRLELPMHLRALTTPDGAQQYSFLYGPVVLAAKIGTQDQAGLFADDSRGGHIASGVQYPAYQMPVIVGEKETILNHLKKLDGKSVTFALQGVQPSRYEGLQLVPFHRLYECRYSVYFPLVSEQEFKAQQEKITQAEKERAAIENVTIDKIVCGEQQPESDHFIKMQNSYAGVDNGVHWREARGWFSYQMKNSAKDATKVRVLFRQEKEREGNILVNGQKIGSLAGSGRDAISTVAFDIPLALRSEIQLEVKFESVNSRTTPRVYEIRLTNQK
jgi:DUF1680 family protein